MLNKFKNLLRKLKERALMPVEFYNDYRHYKKWNYSNLKNNKLIAYESRILRQAHVIEKGLSLSSPRKGFGVSKIETLIELLYDYIEKGYSTNSFVFVNSIYVIDSYIEFQDSVNYKNEKINELYKNLKKYIKNDGKAGINKINSLEICKQRNGLYPEFFCSRHSVRQFSDKNIDVEDIKKAVSLARNAPTACNRQATKVYFYENPAINNNLGKYIAGNTGFEKEVKNYLVITADAAAFYDTFERNQLYIEAGIFTMALVEALHYYGIASCILQCGEKHKFDKKFREICQNISSSERIVLFIAIGYYKDEFSYALSNRKPVEEIFICK